MLNLKNIPIGSVNTKKTANDRFVTMKGNMDTKMSGYLRYLGTKNAINRAVDYHYLCLPVQDSTAPVNGIDYIHPSVKPVVDYATAVIAKGLMPNGEINFEFIADNEADEEAARQATNMVHQVVNEMNNPHHILERWIMDACMHKNGLVMVKPIREPITRYVESEGTADQLTAFELQAAESGLTAMRQSKRQISVNMEAVMAEVGPAVEQMKTEMGVDIFNQTLDTMNQLPEDADEIDNSGVGDENMGNQQAILNDAIRRNTIYRAKYKLTGYNINVQFHPIQQHFWVCDPNVTEIKNQPFCGFYDPMSVAEAKELFPEIDLEEFMKHADYNLGASGQSGDVLNNLAIHARDSVPVGGTPVGSAQGQDPYGRQVSIVTVWNRYDIDNDGDMEIVEVIYSGDYIISATEVEFIPVANMCPKPLPGNFYGMSVGESVIPMQEYQTAAARAEIQLGLLTATPRIGVKPDKVDFEMMQDGEAAIFILDSKFDPSKDVYPMPAPSGNLQFLEVAMNRIQQDTMAMVGMTTPQDVFNPEVMGAGNSGVKLQMALTPNQIIQDNTIRNAAEGIREAIWLVWRTLIQYGDDYGVKKLAQTNSTYDEPVFLDYMSWDDMNFCDRKQIQIELAIGMKSEENSLARLQIIQKCQQDLYNTTQGMASSGALTPEVFKKIKKPYADTLYVLGVKNCDTYLPSDDEVMQMIKQVQEQGANKQPSPGDQKDLSSAKLNDVKAQILISENQGIDAETQLDLAALRMGKPKVYS